MQQTKNSIAGQEEGKGELYSREEMLSYGKEVLRSISHEFLNNPQRTKASLNDQVVIQAVGETIINFPLPQIPTPASAEGETAEEK